MNSMATEADLLDLHKLSEWKSVESRRGGSHAASRTGRDSGSNNCVYLAKCMLVSETKR